MTELFIYIPNPAVAEISPEFEDTVTKKLTSITYQWVQIELMEETTIPLTFNIADIADFTKRNSSFSKTITIPGTIANNILFKHLYNIDTVGAFVMERTYPCYLLQDTQLVFEGNFELSECKIVGEVINYEAIIFSDATELIASLGDKLLRGNEDSDYDLDFSEYDHVLNWTNVRDSYSATAGSGYTYITVDKTGHWYNDVLQGSIFTLDELTPCLFIKEIWDKIFQKAGFRYTSNFITGATFSRLIYPHTDRWLYHSDATLEQMSSTPYGADSMYVSTDSLDSDPPTVVSNDENWSPAYVDQGTASCWGHNEYTVQVPGYYDIKYFAPLRVYLDGKSSGAWNVQHINSFGFPNPERWHRYAAGQIDFIYYNAVADTETILDTVVTDKIDLRNNYGSLGGSAVEVTPITPIILNGEVTQYANVGDKFYIKMSCSVWQYLWYNNTITSVWAWNDGIHDIDINFIVNTDTSQNLDVAVCQIQLNEKITDDALVPMTQVLHNNVKQADFLTSIIRMFNLYVENIGSRHLRIEPRNDYYNINKIALDWTSKADGDKETSISVGTSYRGSFINLRYSDDDDTFNKTYKEATGKQYGEYIKKAEDTRNNLDYKVELIFAPTPGGWLCSDNSMQCPKIFSVDTAGNIEEDKNFKPRILYWKGTTTFLTGSYDAWFVYNNKGQMQPLPIYSYPYAGHFNNTFGTENFDLNFAACDWYWYEMNGTWATYINLSNFYYGELLEEISSTETKLVKKEIILQKKDIQELKFYRPIFIDGSYYRLNKINDWVPNKPSIVELLKTDNLALSFSGKIPRPSIVRPIGLINARPTQYIDLIDGTQLSVNNDNIHLNVDLFDGTQTTDVIDANTGVSINATKVKYYVDVIDANIKYAPMTINEIIFGSTLKNTMLKKPCANKIKLNSLKVKSYEKKTP